MGLLRRGGPVVVGPPKGPGWTPTQGVGVWSVRDPFCRLPLPSPPGHVQSRKGFTDRGENDRRGFSRRFDPLRGDPSGPRLRHPPRPPTSPPPPPAPGLRHPPAPTSLPPPRPYVTPPRPPRHRPLSVPGLRHLHPTCPVSPPPSGSPVYITPPPPPGPCVTPTPSPLLDGNTGGDQVVWVVVGEGPYPDKDRGL